MFASWSALERENLTAASHTFKIQFHTANPATASIRNARITALLLADLGTVQYAESEAESKTTSTTYVDKTTLSMTPATRGDRLQISSALGRQENASQAFYGNIDVDGTSEGETIHVPGGDKIYRSFMFLSKHNSPASLHTMKIQWKTSNAAKNSEAFIKNANIVHFQVDTAESYSDSGHTAVDNYFDSLGDSVYVWAHGLRPSGNTTYAVTYYDGSPTGGGQKVATDSGLTTTAYGNLSSQYLLNTDTGAFPGT